MDNAKEINLIIVGFSNNEYGIINTKTPVNFKLSNIEESAQYYSELKSLQTKKQAESIQVLVGSDFDEYECDELFKRNIASGSSITSIKFMFKLSDISIDYTVGDTYYTYE